MPEPAARPERHLTLVDSGPEVSYEDALARVAEAATAVVESFNRLTESPAWPGIQTALRQWMRRDARRARHAGWQARRKIGRS